LGLADVEPKVRTAAAEALAQVGEPRWRGLINGEDEDFAAIGQSGDDVALKQAVAHLTSQLKSEKAWKAAVALGRIGHPSAIPSLVGVLDSDIGQHASNALAELGDTTWGDCFRGEDFSRLLEIARTGDSRTYEHVFRILTQILKREIADERRKDASVASYTYRSSAPGEAADALVRLEDPRVYELLIQTMGSTRAAEHLGTLGDPKSD